MASIDELLQNTAFTVADRSKVTFLPDPPRQDRKYTFISVDDHIVEPPDAFEGRMPAKFAGQAPRVVEQDGSHVWIYDGKEFPNVGFNAVVGRPVDEYSMEPSRFDDMRRGSWDIHERIKDMDLSGVYASLCFPSFLPGFAGQRLQLSTKDAELALAATRAWNDWNIEAWSGAYPDRMIPCQLPYFLDPEVGAQEIRRNAERGFKAVTFTEAPHLLGLPSLHTGHWDPIMRACEETGTVINLHIGSSGTSPSTAPDMLSYHEMYGTWKGIDLTPAEVLLRNFYFCAVEDPSSFALRDVIGVDHIFLEQDYPHCDSTWPHTQRTIEEEIGGLPDADVRKMTWENASRVYRHPVPPAVQNDPDAY